MAWIELGIFGSIIIEHLQLTHAHIGRVSTAGIADRQTIVATCGNFDFQAHHKIRIFLGSEDGAALARLAGDRTVHDLIVVHRAFPSSEVLAIEDRDESIISDKRGAGEESKA